MEHLLKQRGGGEERGRGEGGRRGEGAVEGRQGLHLTALVSHLSDRPLGKRAVCSMPAGAR